MRSGRFSGRAVLAISSHPALLAMIAGMSIGVERLALKTLV